MTPYFFMYLNQKLFYDTNTLDIKPTMQTFIISYFYELFNKLLLKSRQNKVQVQSYKPIHVHSQVRVNNHSLTKI